MNWPRSITILVVAYVAVFLQSHVEVVRRVVGAQVDILPSLMVYAGLAASLPAVALVALVSGFWVDSLSANPLGLSVLPLLVAGMVAHVFRGVIFRGDVGMQYLLGLGASALVPLMTLGLLLAAGEDPLYGGWFAWRWVVGAALGGLFMPLFFGGFALLDGALNYRPESVSSFRPDREIDRGRDAHAHH